MLSEVRCRDHVSADLDLAVLQYGGQCCAIGNLAPKEPVIHMFQFVPDPYQVPIGSSQIPSQLWINRRTRLTVIEFFQETECSNHHQDAAINVA